MRKKKRLVDVDGRRGANVIDVDPLVNRERSVGGDAVGDEHAANRFGRGKEAIDLPMLPTRKRVASQMEIDAARDDERRRLHRRSTERQRERRHGGRVRVVGMHDVRVEPFERARQPPPGGEIDLGSGGDRHQLQSLGSPLQELPVRMRHERRTMPDGAKSMNGQKHLILTAAPRSRRVDVKGKHRAG